MALNASTILFIRSKLDGTSKCVVRGNSIDHLTARLEELDMDDKQRKRNEVFLCKEEKIGGDLLDVGFYGAFYSDGEINI